MGLPRRPVLAVAGLAVASAAVALVLSVTVFPDLSINNDEGIYRLHAETLAGGHVFAQAPAGLANHLRPWLAAVRDGKYVLKYNPAVPSLIALSLLLSGGPGLFLALVAAGATAMTYVLAREVLDEDWDAVVAAGLVALSPLVILQSALLLPYLTTFVLLEAFCWGLLRGGRGLVCSGLALGAAFVVRPYDAVLFGLPLLVWFLLTRPAWRRVISFLIPAALISSTFFAYNAIATGSPLKPSFSLLESQDTLGFGTRRLYPADPAHQFGLSQGVEGVVHHVGALNTWLTGGVILFALAAVAVLRRRAGSVGPWLAATAVLLPIGYVFFWGPWNASVLWGGTRYVGPFYFLPVLVPLAVLGARGLSDLFRVRQWVGIGVGVALVAVSAPTLVRAIGDNVDFDDQTQSLASLVDHGAPSKVILADLPTPFLMHPSAVVGNNWDMSGPTVFAIGDPARDLDVVAAFARRTPYRLTFTDDFTRPGVPFVGRLQQLRQVTGAEELLTVTARPSRPGEHLAIAVTARGLRRTYPLDESSMYRGIVAVNPAGATVVGRSPSGESPDQDPAVRVQLLRSADDGSEPIVVASESLPWRNDGSVVTVLAPSGASWTVGHPAPAALEVVL